MHPALIATFIVLVLKRFRAISGHIWAVAMKVGLVCQLLIPHDLNETTINSPRFEIKETKLN